MTAVWSEVRSALTGGLKLARGDPRGMGFFDTSIDGFWRSFRAALICYPFYLILLNFRVAAAHWEVSGAPRIVTVDTIGFVISWVAFPLLVLPLTRWLGREERFLAFMVAYNWCQVLQTLLFVLLGTIAAIGLLRPELAQLAEFAAAVAVLLYEWYIARVALALSASQAVPVVLVDLLLGTALSWVTEALY